MAMNCVVCKNECGGAHKCIKCDLYVHLICGNPLGGEKQEGHGQSVECDLSKDNSKSKGKNLNPSLYNV